MIISLLKGPLYEYFLIPFSKGTLEQSSVVEIIPVVLEKKYKIFVNIFSLFIYYFSLQKGLTPHLNIL